ncbi:MFS transporter [Nonomuraea sp. MCN248]|uniref:MFS transporter n=1 Tax=Nonomuraea corallina TaxID=2989783 RepID=A0ABT4SIU2_9ACTN|nr:MFS transporter [Nonomuraea corallina]MDA0637123.1 MFS transporter [Nonomuraea corallina]
MTMTVDSTYGRARWLAVTSLAMGTFAIVTSEMLPVGLLTSISGELGVSDGTAGLMMSAPGLVAAVAAPVLAIIARRLDRRATLVGLMALLAVANLGCALAPDHLVMLAARVLTGVSIGGFWAFAAGLGPRLVPDRSVGRATSTILSGVSVATVLGVPTAAFVSSFAGWRLAFAALGLVALVLVALLAATLPPLPGHPRPEAPGPAGPSPNPSPDMSGSVRPEASGPALDAPGSGSAGREDPGSRRGKISRPLRVVLVLTVLIISGHFAAYTYVRPFLEQVAGAGSGLVGTALLLYGAAGVLGNFAAGAWAARRPRAVLVTLAVLMAVATAALPLIGQPLVALMVWGLGYGGVGVTLQLWIMRSGGGELGTALFVAAFNVSIALGAFAGGRVADGVSVAATMWPAAALAAVSAAVAGIGGRSTRNGS